MEPPRGSLSIVCVTERTRHKRDWPVSANLSASMQICLLIYIDYKLKKI